MLLPGYWLLCEDGVLRPYSRPGLSPAVVCLSRSNSSRIPEWIGPSCVQLSCATLDCQP